MCLCFVSKQPTNPICNELPLVSTNNEYNSVTGCLKFRVLYSIDFGTKGIPDCKEHYHFRQGPLLLNYLRN